MHNYTAEKKVSFLSLLFYENDEFDLYACF